MEKTVKKSVNKLVNKIKDLYRRYRNTKIGTILGRFFSKGDRRFVLSLYGIAFCVFGFTLLTNHLVIAITGDFKLQEIPFYYNGYDDWWTSLLSGEFAMWDDSGFLGQNNIGTNTFYYLWNIFFLPTLLVPRTFVPQALAFLIVTKIVLAGLVMKKLLTYFNVTTRNAKIVATCYAFSGWTFFYLWFNHFLEIAVLFPLVLFGIEKVLKEKKVGMLTISLFVSAMTNYFFFIMFCFCGVIYALFRFFQLWKTYKDWKERLLVLGLGVASFAIAILMALMILIPAFRVAMTSSRADTDVASSYVYQLKECLKNIIASLKGEYEPGFGTAFSELLKHCFTFQDYAAKKEYMYPIISYFFPPYSCYDSPLFSNNGYDNTNCSFFMYTPLTLMLIPSLFVSAKEKKISHFIGLAGIILMLFSPFFYYCFTGFTTVCYGRWQLFVVAVGCIYFAINLDKLDKMQGWYFDISIVLSLVSEVLLIVFALKYQGTMSTNEVIKENYVDDRIICAALQCLYILIAYIIIRQNFKKKFFGGLVNLMVFAEVIFCGNMVLLAQGTVPYEDLYGGLNDVNSSIRMMEDLNKTDKSYYRVFNTSADRDANNMGLNEHYRGLGAFHSMYNYSLDEFGEWSRLTYTTSSESWRPWSMGVHEKRADIDSFLGVKYYLVNNNDSRIAKSNYMVSIQDGYWLLNDIKTTYEAFSWPSISYDSGEYVIRSILLKDTIGNMDVYTVEFETNTDETENKAKAFNVTISNTQPIEIKIGDNGNWFFNSLDIGVKGCPASLNDAQRVMIKSFQKLDAEGDNEAFNFTFTNGKTSKCVLSKGEDTNVPFGYKEIARDKYNVLYENENFINLGFAFDSLLDKKMMSSHDNFFNSTYYGRTIKNEAAYLRTAILDKEDINEIVEKYPDVFDACLTHDKDPYNNPEINEAIKVYNIDNKYIDVYLQNWNHEQGIALDYAAPVKYPANNIEQIYWNSYMDVDLSNYQIASEASSRGGAYLTINGRMGENLLITLYGEDEDGNEHELTRDIHMKQNYDKSHDWKYERGFYVNERVTRIVVRAYDTFAKDQKFAKPNITVQYYDTYKANLDKQKTLELKNVVVKTNGFTFDTNYLETKMEVLNVPYDEGWTLTRIDENGIKTKVKLYKAQGGFNSFVAEKGNYSYSLDYVTPGLSLGLMGSGIGFTLFSFLYVGFDLVFADKKAIKEALRV